MHLAKPTEVVHCHAEVGTCHIEIGRSSHRIGGIPPPISPGHRRNSTRTHMQYNLQEVGEKNSHQNIVRKALGHAKSRMAMYTDRGRQTTEPGDKTGKRKLRNRSEATFIEKIVPYIVVPGSEMGRGNLGPEKQFKHNRQAP